MIVPFMAIGYILLALVILFVNFNKIGEVFGLIFSCAFNMNAVFGAVFGLAINGASNGASSPTKPAKVLAHKRPVLLRFPPAKQGLVQAFSVYVDTLFVCTATAVMILATNSFNVADRQQRRVHLRRVHPGVAKGNFTHKLLLTLFFRLRRRFRCHRPVLLHLLLIWLTPSTNSALLTS